MSCHSAPSPCTVPAHRQYRFDTAVNQWFGHPRLTYTYSGYNSTETDVPSGYPDDLYSTRALSHDVSATMAYGWGTLGLGYNQVSIRDQTGSFGDQAIQRTSVRAGYLVAGGLTLNGSLSHYHEHNKLMRDTSRRWSGRLGLRWSGRGKTLRLNYGLTDFDAFSGSNDLRSNRAISKFTWQVNPEMNLWLRGDYRDSNTSNDYRVIFGVELGEQTPIQ